jgi:hypothetical protein
MKRYGIVLAAALALALALGIVARIPRHPGEATAGAAAPLPTASLRVAFADGAANPATASVPANHRVRLTLVNAGTSAITPALAGYEDRVTPGTLAPGGTWSGEFVSDRPGEAFAWLLDGEPVGRLSVSGSHLVEGHR